MNGNGVLAHRCQDLTCDALAVAVKISVSIDVLTAGHAVALAYGNARAAADLHAAREQLYAARSQLIRLADELTPGS